MNDVRMEILKTKNMFTNKNKKEYNHARTIISLCYFDAIITF